MANFKKIINDSINGPQNISHLSISECITLLAVHNKKFIEALMENGNSFDLYANDHHLEFNNLANFHDLTMEEIQIIETGNLYSSRCNFLFNEHLVGHSKLETLINLCNKGFFNFPPRANDGLSMLDWIRQNPQETYLRETLSHFPVLIPTLNIIQNDVGVAERHFHNRTPQYARYMDAICITQRDPDAMKSIHEVYSSLLIADEVITHFQRKIRPELINLSSSMLTDFLSAVDLSSVCLDLSEKELVSYLQSSELNFVLNWIFNSSYLNKGQRVEFLVLLSSGPKNTDLARNHLIQNNLC